MNTERIKELLEKMLVWGFEVGSSRDIIHACRITRAELNELGFDDFYNENDFDENN